MAACKECTQYGLSCTICGDASHRNPELCDGCQHWDDMTHMLRCQHEKYTITNVKTIFTLESRFDPAFADGLRDHFYRELCTHAISERLAEHLSFRALEDVKAASHKACMLCRIVEEEVREHLAATQLNGTAMGFMTWMPFPISYYDANVSRSPAGTAEKQQDGDGAHFSEEEGNHGSTTPRDLSQRCVVPVFVSAKAADGAGLLIPLTLELTLHFEGHGHGLIDITRWNRSTIDVEAIKSWLSDCQEHHDENCNSMVAAMPTPESFRLIDTTNWCVVVAPASARYLALSYVWGSSGSASATQEPFQLERRNAAELGKENALKDAGDKLPELLVDAIQLSADLGYRYLWVDRLCIVQDDEGHKGRQLNAMNAIYHAADLTIVALGNGSAPGLQGASSRPRKRRHVNEFWDFIVRSRGDIGVQVREIHIVVQNSPWNTRGWTYQERLLSRRHLFLTETNFYLNCYNSRFASEANITYGRGYEKGIRALGSSPTALRGDVFRYTTAVQDYTMRNLTYGSDILNAFAGIGNIFALQNDTTMLFGLPAKHLTQALLWHHQDSHTFRTRGLPDGPHIPSWSWAAWEGKTSYTFVRWSFESQRYCMDAASDAHVGCLVRFNYSDPSSGAVIPVKEDWSWFRGDTPDVDVWRTCVHSPSEANRNASITDESRALAQTVPGSLVFNTTVAFATLSKAKNSSYEGKLSYGVIIKSGHEFERWWNRGRFESESDTDSKAADRVAFDILDRDGNQVGQTFPLWDASEEDDDHTLERTPRDLLKRLQPDKEYAVAVVAACRSNYKLASGSANPSGLVVMILDHDGDTGVSRRLAIGAVNPAAWSRLEPQWNTVVLV